jgi:Glycosyltransferase
MIFSLRRPDTGPEQEWNREILEAVHCLPEGDEFAAAVDAELPDIPKQARKTLREWRGRNDSLRLYQAVYVGVRLGELGISHIHAHFAGMAARTAYWIRKFFGVSYSVTVHANDIFAPNNFPIDLAQILCSADQIVTVSDFGVGYLRDRFPHTADRIHRVYNGIELHDFEPAGFESPPLIVSVGRLISKKGFDVLIDACAILRERDLEFRCEIIGEGPLEQELQTRIRQRNVTEQVRLSGPKTQREIIKTLSNATVFALPCRVDPDGAMDNLPTVIMEAMAAALPVISTDVGGIREMVVDGETGFLVRKNNPMATAEAISRFIRDTDVARLFGQRGRDRATHLFSIQDNVRALRQIIA